MRSFICQNCNKEFTPSQHKSEQPFCGKTCYWNFVHENGFPEIIEKKCLWCGETFVPDRRRQKWCSRNCFEEYAQNKEHGWAWKGGRAKCSICGREMSYTSGERRSIKQPICMGCREKGHNPWGREHPNFTGYCVSGHPGERLETWKRKINERDNYKCVNCGIDQKAILQGAHIISISENPDLAIDIENGVTLCANCHILLDKGIINFSYPYRKEVE